MAIVNTAGGPVESAALGRTLMHEHVAVRTPGIRENWPELWDQQHAIDSCVERLNAAAAGGIGTIVDATPADMGRDPALLAAVAARTSVHIIVSSGIYWEVPRFWRLRTPDELARAFVHDVTAGIGGSAIHAGVLKAATGPDGVTTANEVCLRAVARAQRASGVPIITHATPYQQALEQARIFEDEGVDPTRVMLGHVGDTTDTDFLGALIARGYMLGMDRFGMHSELLTLDDRIATVARLCAAGHARSLMLSHDTASSQDWFAGPEAPHPNMPNGDLNLITDHVLPALRAQGVTEPQIETMLVENPRRLFERQSAY